VSPAGGSITDAFNTAPITIPLASEPQGEAIGFDPNGRGYFTLSEGSSQPVYYYNRTSSPPGAMYWDNDGIAPGTYATTGAGMGGSGTWNSAARNWYTGGAEVPWVNGDDAIFWGAAGTVTLEAGQSVNSLAFKSNGYSLVGAAVTLTGSSAITVDTGLTATIGAPLAGPSGLVKNGLGTLVLTIGNTYSGTTTVAAGALMLANTTGSATSIGQVTVNAGAVLGGVGMAQGDVSNQGAVAPGVAAGTLHVGGSYTQGAAASLEIELASASTYDKLAITGAASLGGTLVVSLIPSFVPTFGDEFAILSASGFGGSVFSAADLPSLPNGLTWNLNYGATLVSLAVGLTGDFDQNGAVDAADYVWWRKFDGTPAAYESWRSNFGTTAPSASGTAIAIPEPRTWMLASIGAAALLVRSLVSHRKS
jgi:autotransporter-associated beta strand protein